MSVSAAPPLQAVFFDMSKTLWRPASGTRHTRSRQAHDALYAALGRYYPALALPDPDRFSEVLQAIEHGHGPAVSSNEEILEHLGTEFGWSLDPADQRLLTAWHAKKLEQAVPEPDLPQTLDALQALGLRLGVISNTRWRRAWHDRELAHHGVLAYFPVRIYSADLGIRKPDPRIFAAALAALGDLPAEEVLYVGDKLDTDVAGAQQAGWRTAWLMPSGKPPALPAGAIQPDIVLAALRDLPTQLTACFRLPNRPILGTDPASWLSSSEVPTP
jgi:HAD superfamily hydrolase (TIGR01549 family)